MANNTFRSSQLDKVSLSDNFKNSVNDRMSISFGDRTFPTRFSSQAGQTEPEHVKHGLAENEWESLNLEQKNFLNNME